MFEQLLRHLIPTTLRPTGRRAGQPATARRPVSPRLVHVWDRRVKRFRLVDLADRGDPLWNVANCVAELEDWLGQPWPDRADEVPP